MRNRFSSEASQSPSRIAAGVQLYSMCLVRHYTYLFTIPLLFRISLPKLLDIIHFKYSNRSYPSDMRIDGHCVSESCLPCTAVPESAHIPLHTRSERPVPVIGTVNA